MQGARTAPPFHGCTVRPYLSSVWPLPSLSSSRCWSWTPWGASCSGCSSRPDYHLCHSFVSCHDSFPRRLPLAIGFCFVSRPRRGTRSVHAGLLSVALFVLSICLFVHVSFLFASLLSICLFFARFLFLTCLPLLAGCAVLLLSCCVPCVFIIISAFFALIDVALRLAPFVCVACGWAFIARSFLTSWRCGVRRR